MIGAQNHCRRRDLFQRTLRQCAFGGSEFVAVATTATTASLRLRGRQDVWADVGNRTCDLNLNLFLMRPHPGARPDDEPQHDGLGHKGSNETFGLNAVGRVSGTKQCLNIGFASQFLARLGPWLQLHVSDWRRYCRGGHGSRYEYRRELK